MNRTNEFLVDLHIHFPLRCAVCASDEDLEEPVDEALSQVDPDVEGPVDDFELLLDDHFFICVMYDYSVSRRVGGTSGRA